MLLIAIGIMVLLVLFALWKPEAGSKLIGFVMAMAMWFALFAGMYKTFN